ncbi:uncharacterized protein VTP21DRAFT_4622 [Calcarisporiella thermophila]|uniref:uncharacterized protein n=1 Tax=Calcarisporiella thermophila TaxID=911321 RepID=UPI003743C25F
MEHPQRDTLTYTTNVDEVVTPQSLHMHLACLHKFYQMAIQDNEELDKLFLNRAEYRYTLWMQIIHRLKANPLPVPPWDVALVWHAHMLSPYRYAEDMIRLYKADAMEINFPLQALHEAIAIDENCSDPESVRFWEMNTKEPYILDLRSIEQISHHVQCPWCKVTNILSWKEFVKMKTTKGTSFSCTGCFGHLNADNLSVRRFLDDMTNKLIAGTVLDLKTGLPDFVTINLEYAYLFRSPHCPMLEFKSLAIKVPGYCTWKNARGAPVLNANQPIGEDAQTIELCQVGNQPWRGPAGADFTGRYYHPGLLSRYNSQHDAKRGREDKRGHGDSSKSGGAASYYWFIPMYPIFVGTACATASCGIREEHADVQDVVVQDVVVQDVEVEDVVVEAEMVVEVEVEVVEMVEVGEEAEEEFEAMVVVVDVRNRPPLYI